MKKDKAKVRFSVRVPKSKSSATEFMCEGWEGQTLTDFVKDGTGANADVLADYLECACSGVMVLYKALKLFIIVTITIKTIILT